MPYNLKTFKKNVPAELLKLAGKHKIRECDEEEKGKFIAFVEDGINDYDVKILLSAKGEMSEHSCDCGSKVPVCSHKLALLLNLSIPKKQPSAKSKSGAKRSETDILLDAVSPEEIKDWLREVFKSQKDLDLLFRSKFLVRSRAFSKEEVFKISQDAVKSVVKSRRRIDKSEVKKIIDIWRQIHKSVLDAYRENPAGKSQFEALSGLLEFTIVFNHDFGSGNSEINKYSVSVIQSAEEALLGLPEAEWNKGLAGFLEVMASKESRLSYFFMTRLLNLYSKCEVSRKELLLNQIMHGFTNYLKACGQHKNEYLRAVLPYLSESDGSFLKHFHLFEPMRFEPDYNEMLVNKLLAINEVSLAEKYCLNVIVSNVSEEYNYPFYELLKAIYSAIGNRDKLLKIKKLLLPFTFSLEDYKQILISLNNIEEAVNFRKKMLSKARYAYTPQAANFVFDLFLDEGDFKKAIKSINAYTPFVRLLEHWNSLLRADRKEFLRLILTEANLDIDEQGSDDYERICKMVMTKMLETIEPEIIKWAVKQYDSSWRDYPFINYLKKNLPF